MPQNFNNIPFDCFRPVTIITDDLIVYQGDIVHGDPRKHDDVTAVDVIGEVEVESEVHPQFLNLALACTPVLLNPEGSTVFTVLLDDIYPTLGTVRINVNQIISVSDFNGSCAANGAAPSAG